MDERNVITASKQEFEGYLKDHYNYETVLRIEDGWKLKFEFVKGKSGEWEQQPDYWIKECDLLEYHKAFSNLYRLFGMPLIGDFISTDTEIVKIVERTFDVQRKLVIITVS